MIHYGTHVLSFSNVARISVKNIIPLKILYSELAHCSRERTATDTELAPARGNITLYISILLLEYASSTFTAPIARSQRAWKRIG